MLTAPGKASGDSSVRRSFIGGSDARIIMGDDEGRCCGFGGRSVARLSPRICRGISQFSWA